MVVETPPALGQPEAQVDPALRRQAFEQQQQAAGGEQLAGVAHRNGEVGAGVQHVRRNDDVVAAALEALRGRVTLDVEHARPHRGVAGELRLRALEEQR